MKINQHQRYQANQPTEAYVEDALYSLIQHYAPCLNFSELFTQLTPEHINWEYFEQVILQQLTNYPESAAHEANYSYFQTLRPETEESEETKKDND